MVTLCVGVAKLPRKPGHAPVPRGAPKHRGMPQIRGAPGHAKRNSTYLSVRPLLFAMKIDIYTWMPFSIFLTHDHFFEQKAENTKYSFWLHKGV